MEPNPYEAPKSPSFADAPKRSAEVDPSQILAEIRDIQRELLDMTRQAVARQRRMVRFLLVLLAVMMLFFFVILASSMFRLAPAQPVPGSPPLMSRP